MKFIQPKDVCTDPAVPIMTGGVSTSQMRTVTADRRRLAEKIAAHITDEILTALEQQDIRNGYPR